MKTFKSASSLHYVASRVYPARSWIDSTRGKSKYPELSNHIRRIVPEERLIEITQNRGDDADLRLRLFVIRILDDDVLYEVTLSGEEEHKTVKSSEWLALLHDTLARLIARIIYAQETSNS